MTRGFGVNLVRDWLDKGQKLADHFLRCVEVDKGWFFEESALRDAICGFFHFLRAFHCFYAA